MINSHSRLWMRAAADREVRVRCYFDNEQILLTLSFSIQTPRTFLHFPPDPSEPFLLHVTPLPLHYSIPYNGIVLSRLNKENRFLGDNLRFGLEDRTKHRVSEKTYRIEFCEVGASKPLSGARSMKLTPEELLEVLEGHNVPAVNFEGAAGFNFGCISNYLWAVNLCYNKDVSNVWPSLVKVFSQISKALFKKETSLLTSNSSDRFLPVLLVLQQAVVSLDSMTGSMPP